MPDRISLSKNRILKDSGYIGKVFLFSIFVVAGLLVQLSPFLYWDHSVSKLLTNMAAMLLLSVPFCYFIGLRNIAQILGDIRKIKAGDFVLEEDRVTHRRRVTGSSAKDSTDCQMDMEKYSSRTGKSIWVNRTEYNRTQVGDPYYMVYVTHKGKQKLYASYPAKRFVPDEELRKIIRAGQ